MSPLSALPICDVHTVTGIWTSVRLVRRARALTLFLVTQVRPPSRRTSAAEKAFIGFCSAKTPLALSCRSCLLFSLFSRLFVRNFESARGENNPRVRGGRVADVAPHQQYEGSSYENRGASTRIPTTRLGGIFFFPPSFPHARLDKTLTSNQQVGRARRQSQKA
jgi:hypothetical protein